MATIQRTLADTAGFIPQAWANEALDVLRRNIVLAKFVARDTDFTQAGWRGKSLTIPYPGTMVASAKTPGSVATVQTPSNGSSASVTLSQHNTVDFILEDLAFDSAQSGVALMEAYGQAAGVALAEQLETDLMSVVGSFANTSLGTINTNINYASVVAARKQLVDNKAPMSDRALILSTKDYAAALQDSSLLGYFQFQSGANNLESIQEAQVKRLAGMDVYESQFVQTANSGTTAHSVQTLTISGAPTGGSFTLTYSGQTTAAIAYNAAASAVESAIQALSNVGTGQARVSGVAGGPWTVVLYLASPVAFTHTDSFTGGSTPALAVADAASTVTATSNIALHKNAILLAVRPMVNPSSAGVEVAYAQDPDSGIGLRVQMQYQPQYRGVYAAFDLLYGFGVLRSSQAAVILA